MLRNVTDTNFFLKYLDLGMGSNMKTTTYKKFGVYLSLFMTFSPIYAKPSLSVNNNGQSTVQHESNKPIKSLSSKELKNISKLLAKQQQRNWKSLGDSSSTGGFSSSVASDSASLSVDKQLLSVDYTQKLLSLSTEPMLNSIMDLSITNQMTDSDNNGEAFNGLGLDKYGLLFNIPYIVKYSQYAGYYRIFLGNSNILIHVVTNDDGTKSIHYLYSKQNKDDIKISITDDGQITVTNSTGQTYIFNKMSYSSYEYEHVDPGDYETDHRYYPDDYYTLTELINNDGTALHFKSNYVQRK